MLKHYEDTYFPEHMENAGKASYVKWNQEMINHSKFCVVYYDEIIFPQGVKTAGVIYSITNPKAEPLLLMTTL